MPAPKTLVTSAQPLYFVGTFLQSGEFLKRKTRFVSGSCFFTVKLYAYKRNEIPA